MKIFTIDNNNIHIVSEFMAKIKPEWWDSDGAAQQLSKGIGWYYGSSEVSPQGWILCKSHVHYKTAEIECLGFDDNGIYKINKELQPLVEESEDWARNQGYVNMRFTIGSRGLSCHNKELTKPWEELKDLHAVDRKEFEWFLNMGYVPSGILPNIYGDKYHGVLLIKEL